MTYTDLEYALVKFHQLHRYDAYANPDKIGLGRCGCGADMYYCEHDPHFARALIAELGLTHEVRTLEDGMGGVSTNYNTGETTVHSKPVHSPGSCGEQVGEHTLAVTPTNRRTHCSRSPTQLNYRCAQVGCKHKSLT